MAPYLLIAPYYSVFVFGLIFISFVVLIVRYKNRKYFLRTKFINRKPKIIKVVAENGKKLAY